MPDMIAVLARRWKLILVLTFTATILALVVSLLRPKQYLAIATALPANSVAADKARIFNSNIEALYPEIGSPDELDRIEGTAKLDTIYIAIAQDFNLTTHYSIDEKEQNKLYKAAWILKDKADIRRSAYGELRIKVWDIDPNLAAGLANAILHKLNDIHQHIQNANNAQVLSKLKEELAAKQKEISSIHQSRIGNLPNDTAATFEALSFTPMDISIQHEQVKEYQKLVNQYELAIKTTPKALIAVENARPSITPDKPKILQTTLFAFGASLLFSFLLAVFADSRKQ